MPQAARAGGARHGQPSPPRSASAPNLDDRPCYAVVEARGHLEPRGDAPPLELVANLPELVAVCDEYGLRLVD